MLIGDCMHRIVTMLNNKQYEEFKAHCEKINMSMYAVLKRAVLKAIHNNETITPKGNTPPTSYDTQHGEYPPTQQV